MPHAATGVDAGDTERSGRRHPEVRRSPSPPIPGPARKQPGRDNICLNERADLLNLRAAGRTDCGKVRKNDEDSYLVDAERGVFAVADGVGGNRGGEIASRLAVEAVVDVASNRNGSAPEVLLEGIFAAARAKITSSIDAEPKNEGMATTLVMLLVRDDGGWVAHCGDSRAYRWRSGKLERLTRDHSFGAELAIAGSPYQSPFAHVLTRSLGKKESGAPDKARVDIAGGDRYLLCCDGLTGMVPEPEIERVLGEGLSPDATCARLIEMANAAGGLDNITAVVVDC